ncbi:MAG: chemotaxis-specific protein-glutamate methyltransferase CheB [Gaiellales bacterium]
MTTAAPTRVVVADDSRLMRHMLQTGLARRGFEVVGSAENGDEALELCKKVAPDVLSLDLAMPGKDGIGVLRELQTWSKPVRVVVVSAFSPAHGARAVDALAEGAVDLVAKPAIGDDLDEFFGDLSAKLEAASRSRARARAAAPRPAAPAAPVRSSRPRSAPSAAAKLVVIASSTGGPKALAELLPQLPATLGQGTIIVQHMPPGFTGSLAERLDRASAIAVREAKDGDSFDPGVALLTPGGLHARIPAKGSVSLTEEPPIGGLRPRADLTIEDAAKLYGPKLLLVVLTGMGRDGQEGAEVVKKHGGRVFVEAESTCTVYGMPRSVSEAGLADLELPLHELAAAIAKEAGS